MHPDNKILISALLILGIALFSLKLDVFTGKEVFNVNCDQSAAYVSNDEIKAGEKIKVIVLPTPNKGIYEGIYSDAEVYKVEGKVEKRVGLAPSLTNICENSKNRCYGAQFDIQTLSKSDAWKPGNYLVKVKDVCATKNNINGGFVEAPFKIII